MNENEKEIKQPVESDQNTKDTPKRSKRSQKRAESRNETPANTVSSLNLSRNLESQLSKDVTNFPFAGALGRKIDIHDATFAKNPVKSTDITIPGICAFDYYPSIGSTLGFNSPVNLAMRNIYSYVTHANSRNASYEPTDLMIYILAVTEVFKMWNNAVRVYGIAKQYSATNRYLAETLIQACGFNPTNMLMNLNDFRAALNVLANKMSSMVIPSTIGYTLHCFSMTSQIYADSENSRAQLYLFRPYAYWKYSETDRETGGSLVTTSMPETSTVESYITLLNDMCNKILGSKYMNVMAADIMKAYGSNLYSLYMIPEEYTVTPIYSDEILETINNIHFAGTPSVINNKSTNDVYQVMPPAESGLSPYLTYAPTVVSPLNAMAIASSVPKIWLNTNYESLSPAQVVDRTNYANWWKYMGAAEANNYNFRIQSRTEIICRAVVYTTPYNGDTNYVVIASSGITNNGDFSAILKTAVFNKFPMFYILSTDYTQIEGIFGDIDNIAFIGRDDMESLDDTIMQIVFNMDTVYPSK